MSSEQQQPTVIVLGTAIAAGVVLCPVVKNINGDLYPWSILSCVIAAHFLVAFGLQQMSDGDFWAAQHLAFWAISCAIVSLWTNVLVYRIFFHPLNHFPGPFGAKLSKFWSLSQVVKSKSRWYRVCVDLHRKYGDYVRTGPNELVIRDPAALAPLLGVRNKRGPFYGATQKSLHTNQDPEFHKQRRKVWDMAFKQTLTDYGPRIEEFTDALLARLDKVTGKEVLVNEFCLHYVYDVMSGVGFGSETRFIECESSDFANNLLAQIQGGIAAIAFLAHVPWMLTIAESLTFLGGPMKLFREWSAEQAKKRRLTTNPRPDIMGHLLEQTPDDAEGRALLDADSRLIIGAGSDTTGSALTVLFMLLAYYRSYQERVREEVEQSFADNTYTCARPQMLLDAMINEALRLAPPILFNLQRYPPKGGIKIGDVYIPEGTVCCIGAYQLHHDPRNFPQPDDFIPERWTSRPELVANKNAFVPFTMGPYMCPGRSIAMMEMRSVIARTVQKYDISFPQGTDFDIQEFLENIKDHFTAGVPELKLVFTPRKVLPVCRWPEARSQ
ncbi:hypothetical protein VTN77DRAFT_4749 [Rasamsonia byssochlamydoides]|uniref:uncharacterized protein n=1 Tax=Rasamsonia byssochlamydoides TaxID=89139 RepID=UPI00374482DC